MLRYLEENGLVVPRRAPSGYRLYGLSEVNRLRSLLDLRQPVRARALRARVRPSAAARPGAPAPLSTPFLAAGEDARSWVEWEQRKHERLLAA